MRRDYESGTTNSDLSPAMREWRRKLEVGYTIGPRLRVGRQGYVEWGPALFDPAGGFVRNIRRGTMRKLMRLGILGEGAVAQDKDASNDACVAPAGDS